MYYVYWIKPDESVGTTTLTTGKALNDWLSWEGEMLRTRAYVYVKDTQKWGTYSHMPNALRGVDKRWHIVPTTEVPSVIRAHHLITH